MKKPKLKKITLEFDNMIYQLEGKQAQRWQEQMELLAENVYVIRFPHSQDFPQIKWDAIKYKKGIFWKKVK